MHRNRPARAGLRGSGDPGPMESGLRRRESHLRPRPDLLTTFRREWSPPQPVRAVVIVHGFAEHSGRYEHVGSWLARRGCAVHALDLPGHGRTAGPRGHIDSFDRLLDHVEAFLEQVRLEHPGLPLHLLGHSMGGLAVTALARDRKPEIASLVTSGAALSPRVPRARRLLARALARVAPRVAFDARLDDAGLSRDPDVIQAYREDPLVFSRASAALGAGMMAAAERCARGGGVRVPMLLMHGGADPICDPAASRLFHASLDVDAELRVYTGLRHEIFNEPEWQEVLGDLLDWLEARERLKRTQRE